MHLTNKEINHLNQDKDNNDYFKQIALVVLHQIFKKFEVVFYNLKTVIEVFEANFEIEGIA